MITTLLLASVLLMPLPPVPAPPPGEDLERARTLLEEGQPAEALDLLERALPDLPSDADRALGEELAGRCHLSLGQGWDAETRFARAGELAPRSPSAARGRGEAFLLLARQAMESEVPRGSEIRSLAADATGHLERARALDPGDPSLLGLLGEARLVAEDPAGAAEAFGALVMARPDDGDAHHRLATALRLAGDREGAARAETACLSLDEGRTDAAAALVGDLLATKGPDEARAVARKSLLRHPGDNGLYAALWRVDAAAGRYVAMEEVLLEVIAAHGEHPVALYYLAFARRDSGRWDEALDAFRRRAAVPPESPRTHLEIGRLMEIRGDAAGAGTAYGKVLDLPEDTPRDRADAVAGLARVAARFGVDRRFAEAKVLYQRLVREAPETPEYHMFLGLSHRRLGEFDEAAASYERARQLNPFDGNATNELGLLCIARGRFDEARDAFLRATEMDPRNTDGLENLGAMARLDGDPAAALEFFREAHHRATAFGDDDKRLRFRRYMDICAREIR